MYVVELKLRGWWDKWWMWRKLNFLERAKYMAIASVGEGGASYQDLERLIEDITCLNTIFYSSWYIYAPSASVPFFHLVNKWCLFDFTLFKQTLNVNKFNHLGKIVFVHETHHSRVQTQTLRKLKCYFFHFNLCNVINLM